MPQRASFTATAPLLLRLNVLRSDEFATLIADFGRDGVPGDSTIASHIRMLSRNPVLTEAIAVSSSALSDALRQISEGPVPRRKKLIRAAISATRYALRITGRPTPFGLYAGVTLAADKAPRRETPSRSPEPVQWRKQPRFDAEWLDAVTRTWLKDPATRRATHVVANSLCFERGDRLILPYVRQRPTSSSTTDPTGRAGRELSLRNTAVVSWIMKKAVHPVPYGDLLTQAGREFPGLPEKGLEEVLARLVADEILLTELSSDRIDEAFLNRLDELRQHTSNSEPLRQARSALRAYADTAPGRGTDAWRRLVALTGSISQQSNGTGTLPQVDLQALAEMRVPDEVRREAEQCASALWRISYGSGPYSHMKAYRRAFLAKYGRRGTVRLTEMVNPHTGLGFPHTYLNPAVPFRQALADSESPTDAGNERTLYLGELVNRGLSDPQREIGLTDEDIEELTVPSPLPPPPSLELCFQLRAENSERLESGAFEMAMTPTAAARSAGELSGRFTDLTDMTAALSDLVRRGSPGGIVAQIRFLPALPRALNLMQVPDLTPHTIPVGVFHDSRAPGVIDWRDLIVADDGDRLRLHWDRTGQEVFPLLPHAVSLAATAPNLVRLLAELRHCHDGKIWQPWDWSPYSSLPCLPRVRLGRTILAPLTWRPGLDLTRAATSPDQWDTTVASWRTRLRIPALVNVAQHDRAYELDLENAFHREILRRDIVRRPEIVITERPGGSNSHGWSGGRRTEVVIPLLRAAPTEQPHPESHVLERERLAEKIDYPPGSEWTFAKLYCGPEVHEELLTNHIPELIERLASHIDSWFFVRFRDPDHHIRLRLHSGSRKVTQQVLPELLDTTQAWQRTGLIRETVMASYEPEVVRYGGPETMKSAEEVFCTDSRLVVQQLRFLARTPEGNRIPKRVLAVVNYAVLLESLGDWDWPAWVVRKFSHGPFTEPELSLASQIAVPGHMQDYASTPLPHQWAELLRPGRTAARRLGTKVLPGLTSDERESRQDTVLLSLLHMHHNRLFGPDPTHERETHALFRTVAESHIRRQRIRPRIGNE
ncbi:hypothetical protein STVIR_0140 [Streptomyces viridochromogenes Tue57]|uniref:Lantibiotic dehydratase domain protein n=1 Tax=Streptomyces viridochromogenes Tue57 TaxID=1160705 RepID=L8PU06_STRVR|nr:hypothetical protein STVIR_0140 [Streptomyces viridochromogenes Tue57]